MTCRLKSIAAALLVAGCLSATAAPAQVSEDNMGTRSEDNMGVMTEDGFRTTQQSGGGQPASGAYGGSSSAARGGPGSGSAAAIGMTNELVTGALANEPLVPAAQNPLLGRWRTTGGNLGMDLSSIGPLGEMSSGMLAGGCESMFGKVAVFGPSSFERVTADGHTRVLRHVEYRGRGLTVAVLAPGTGAQPTILRLSDPNHATSAMGCTLERDASGGGDPGGRMRASARRMANGEGYLRMEIGSTGPAGFSPLANSHVWITREDPADVLAKAGYQAGPRGSTASTLAANCGTPFDCNQIFLKIGETAVQMLKPGPDGLGSSEPLSAGAYYVVALAPYQQKAMVWALPVSLRAGSNEFKLDQSNGQVVR
jgi:hypothetical protein